MKFKEFDFDEDIVEAISYMGFETATPIQEQAIPAILDNRDLIACAQTGTGKTAAFVLPVLQKIALMPAEGINTLVIVPTRELAIQIEQQVQGLSYFLNIGSVAIYGGGDGKDFVAQKSALKKGTDMVIATPGKLLAHLQMGYVDMSKLEHLILDEADRMLDMGFIDDLTRIIKYLPEKRQTLMFSATMPDKIRSFAKKILTKPSEISLAVSKPAEGVKQSAYMTFDEQKVGTMVSILKDRKHYDSIIVFTSTKSAVNDIVRKLKKGGFPAKGISSNLEQHEREEVMIGFRSKRTRILVATDLMSRGIDVKEINMVVNYDVPHDAEDYVHRVGRTARAETDGEAVTLINPKDMFRMQKIERLIEMKLEKLQPPEELGKGPVWKESQPRSGKSNYQGDKGRKSGKKYYHKKGGKPRN